MKFENACNCIVDYSILEKAIEEECGRRNITPKEEYKIYLYRGYAGISIKHDKVSVHRIIGKYIVGFNFGSEIHVHHIDGDKLNNDISNLQVIKKSLHTKEHNLVQYVSEEYKRSFGDRMKHIVSRSDVAKEDVIFLRNKGLTINQIAEKLDCGYNTVCRRLGMRNQIGVSNMGEIRVGDIVMCVEYPGNPCGIVVKQYRPTACGQQTMIKCNDGRLFHAPTSDFRKIR